MLMDEDEAQRLYTQLGHLLGNVPVDNTQSLRSHDAQMWLARAIAIVERVGNIADVLDMRSSMTNMIAGFEPKTQLAHFLGGAYRTLAILELKVPAPAQGSFIAAGNVFDALKIFAAAVKGATKEVLVVDPYMDANALTDFAALIPEQVLVRLLADTQYHKPGLKPSVTKWQAQYTQTRPLDCKLSPAKTLHDRLLVIDKSDAWVMTQSLNAIAARAPATIVKVDAETAALKVAAYEAIWLAANTI